MEEEQGLTIGEIFKVIFKRVWWVIGVTAAALIVAVLLIQLIYNKGKVEYSVSYELVYPGSESNLYPDGTEFALSDIVSFATLESIQASDEEKFGSIDIKSMAAEDDISITKVTDDASGGTYFKIDVLAKYFKSNEQAADFLRALAENPVVKINAMVGDAEYQFNLTAYDLAKTYEDKIAYLSAQKTYILSMYDELIGKNSEYLYYEVNGSSLSNYRLGAEAAYTDQDYQAIVNDLKVNQYVYDGEYESVSLNSRKAALEKQKEENNTKIENLEEERTKLLNSANSSINTVESFNTEIIKLVNANSDIDVELADIEKALADIESNSSGHAIFDEKLAAIRANLAAEAETLKTVRSAFYSEKSRADYKGNKITADGGMNIILAALIGAVIGFLVVAIVIYIIDAPKYKREKYALRAAEAGDKPEEPEVKDGKEPAPAAEAAAESENKD